MIDQRALFRDAIRAALGHAPASIEPGRISRFPSSGRKSDDAGWAWFSDDERVGVYGDHRTGLTATWHADGSMPCTLAERVERDRTVRAAAVERQRREQTSWTRNARRIATLWASSSPIEHGDPVDLYLRNRSLGAGRPWPRTLRLHTGLPYYDGDQKLGVFPTMVVPVTADDGRVIALHRTFLTTDGRKADVPSPKKLTPAAGALTGAAIRLATPRAGVIGIGEGIETALAAGCLSGIPVVAAYCAGNLAAWRWPAGTRRIVIFGDNDAAGRDAAIKLADRVRKARINVEVAIPFSPGLDWSDVYASHVLSVAAVAPHEACSGGRP